MSLYTITGGGSFTNANISQINANFSQLFAGFTPGNIIYCNPSATGVAGPQDGTLAKPYTSLLDAYGAGRSGTNDVIVLIGNGATSGSARLSAGMTWAKDALHLVGVSSGVSLSNRSRIAPTSGATAFANFFTVSGNGCLFKNIQWFQGFDTGTTAQICVTVTGGRNLFDGCHIAGMGDAASAQDTGSRNLKISGTGENEFVNCTIGIDTVTRTVANASVEFASGTPRNQFINCVFPFMTSAAGVLGIITSAAASMDRFQHFVNCAFINAIGSTSTAMTALCTLAASSGGILLFGPGCCFVGITDTGSNATTFGQIYIGAPANSGTAGGAAVVAS